MRGEQNVGLSKLQVFFEAPRDGLQLTMELAHLAGSAELASLADLQVRLGPSILPLHSAVLATHCKVLYTAFCAAGSDKESKQQVVQRELEQYPVPGAKLFISLIYDPSFLAGARPVSSQALDAAVRLSNKMDAPLLLSVSCGDQCRTRGRWRRALLSAGHYCLPSRVGRWHLLPHINLGTVCHTLCVMAPCCSLAAVVRELPAAEPKPATG